MREIILDTETTGLDPVAGHKIIEIGCVELFHGSKTGKTFQLYINPNRDVPQEATRVHGITTEFLKDKPVFSEIAQSFIDFIGDARLVIHNAQFDMKFLNYELQLIEQAALSFERVIDTLEIARRKFPGSPASLDALCKKFSISNEHRKFHGALLDAELLAEVYIALLGGKQAAFALDANQTGNAELPANKERAYKEPRSFPASEQEKAAHMEFLKSIKNPIWLKETENS